MSETGFVIMARLTGFDAFVMDTELDHGSEATADLLQAVLDHLSRSLTVKGLRTDHIWAVSSDDSLGRPAVLLDVLERLFVVFRDTQRQMVLNTVCPCRACRQLPQLGLALVVHHGSYLPRSAGDQLHFISRDMIVARHLLTHLCPAEPAYLALTREAIHRLGVETEELGMRPQTEYHDHLGRMDCFVVDLEPVWEREMENRVVRVDAAEAVASGEIWLPVPPPVAWDWLTSPAKRLRYESGAREVRERPLKGRRPGAGMIHHCDHGHSHITLTFLDWRPYRYFTFDAEVRPLSLLSRGTVELVPENSGTRVKYLFAPSPAGTWWERLLLRTTRARVGRHYAANLEQLARLLDGAGPRTAVASTLEERQGT